MVNPFENVELSHSNLSAVDVVENLKINECAENVSEKSLLH